MANRISDFGDLGGDLLGDKYYTITSHLIAVALI